MKKYYSIALSFFSVFSLAQEMISFESAEGFVTGSIHGQGNWISTPTGGTPAHVTHQVISSDNASNGNTSLKIVRENVFGTQPEPVIGGFYNVSAPLSVTDFSVSFDIHMSQLNGSVFGFQGVNNTAEQMVVRIDFDKTGIIKILNRLSGSLELVSTPAVWAPDTWYRFKIVGTAANVRYYMNDILIYTGIAVSSFDIDQLRFVHDNDLGTAYIDHIKINSETLMSVKETIQDQNKALVYPNPARDYLKISVLHKIDLVEMYDASGKKTETVINGNNIDVRGLNKGLYMIHIKSGNKNFTEKFIKE
ncbi:T9SS type A sorting domain-containing protein [Chryseobacterium flavum]|uniref:T9SS type A sorting domain-containing protein n=1 Tax=Chryseobacterium flavum TaxID=415851 RepID=UPI0028AC0DE4|nr:T9SS type A sorting domain-containing protein [Chryseobacterium flavum]